MRVCDTRKHMSLSKQSSNHRAGSINPWRSSGAKLQRLHADFGARRQRLPIRQHTIAYLPSHVYLTRTTNLSPSQLDQDLYISTPRAGTSSPRKRSHVSATHDKRRKLHTTLYGPARRYVPNSPMRPRVPYRTSEASRSAQSAEA
jgi:hypothetical protein